MAHSGHPSPQNLANDDACDSNATASLSPETAAGSNSTGEPGLEKAPTSHGNEKHCGDIEHGEIQLQRLELGLRVHSNIRGEDDYHKKQMLGGLKLFW